VERVCQKCGRVYRGLVCQACHPRRKKAEAEVKSKAEVKAETEAEVKASEDV